jgi:hypothetical protein
MLFNIYLKIGTRWSSPTCHRFIHLQKINKNNKINKGLTTGSHQSRPRWSTIGEQATAVLQCSCGCAEGLNRCACPGRTRGQQSISGGHAERQRMVVRDAGTYGARQGAWRGSRGRGAHRGAMELVGEGLGGRTASETVSLDRYPHFTCTCVL